MKLRLRLASVVLLGTLVGCGASRDEGLISSTRTELSDANSALLKLTASIENFMKAKESKDAAAAETIKTEKQAMTEAARTLKQSAQKLQGLYRQAESAALPTPEEREAFRKANKSKLEGIANAVSELADTYPKFKTALDECSKKYEKDITETLKELQDANLMFASIKPSATRTR
jgi:chromosome segregation ATPase